MKEMKQKKSKKNLWKESVKYLGSTKNYIFAAIAIFFLSTLIGFFFPENFTFFNETLRGLSERIQGMGAYELVWFIFQNNLMSAFFATILGIFLGIFPVVNAIMNGTILGYVSSLAVEAHGFSTLLLLVPHGIFELPAIFIALGLGMRLGFFVFSKDRKKELKERFFGSMKVFLTMVLPLLIIAAIIEGILIASAG